MQKTPPRYVPTLTQVVSTSQPAASPPPRVGGYLGDEAVVHQVAQQVRHWLITQASSQIELTLQSRVREVVSQLALAHAHQLLEAMKPQLETVVAQVVEEAVAQALEQLSPRAA